MVSRVNHLERDEVQHANRGRQARAALLTVACAQAHGPNQDGPGIMAASKDGLADGEGDSGHASLHTGPAACILAARHVNPRSATIPIAAQ
jgi:hypothetical protein